MAKIRYSILEIDSGRALPVKIEYSKGELDSLVEAAGRLADDDDRADDPLITSHRHRENGPIPGPVGPQTLG